MDNVTDYTSIFNIDQYTMDKKYFFNTLPRRCIPVHNEIDLEELKGHAELNVNIEVDTDLVGCLITFLFRCSGYRLRSVCTIRAVQDDKFRGFSGKFETLVDLERSDESMAQIGLSLHDQWTLAHEENKKDFTWFIGDQFDQDGLSLGP